MCFGTGGAAAPSVDFIPAGPVRMLPLTTDRRTKMESARAIRAALLKERDRRIDEMWQRAREQGDVPERMYWVMVYDFEMAPATNGRTMLLERGVLPVPPQDLSEDTHIHEALWTVIEGLAASRVFLLNTDHLTDSQLYERLFYKILDEPTQCMPPSSGACEFIDVLHGMDIDAGGFGKELNEALLNGTRPIAPLEDGKRAPFQTQLLADRDRFLPRAFDAPSPAPAE